ncbi:prepilin-type N-terminal cleavage/methylation domain-containing protein [Paraglaciecola aquimarina]|uniref:Prepilin-type N-terminal cleavage/methylation domain-containing protein n=1 Tax=Paraglaciecola algarum TaxID=3050085 RepID=A0ABS9D7I6_9ALTE|nr:type IV pilin protein [Paraglaciecola sp. G1-23]MCF2948345.1 prepilin-type N-terminal cleavage/methylation domain-containing protein [Paraglaciecola sp. G1-23]
MKIDSKSLVARELVTQKFQGMTLVELMLVVLIIGLLATLVFPSFQKQIQQARRNDGINQLLRLKLQQEAFRTKNNSYALAKQLSLPTSDYYTFSIDNVSATTYELVATAKGSQVADKTCKVLSINQSMHKTPAGCFN